MENERTTFPQHLRAEQQASDPFAEELSVLLGRITLATKTIAEELSQIALLNRLGYTGEVNVQGEKVKKLDQWANEVFVETLKDYTCTMVSEEMDDPLHLRENCKDRNFTVCFDPIDGSSNIDTNGVLGTIFSVRRRRASGPDHVAPDILQKGTEQIAAGYVMYGPSTILVYSSGDSVNAFTLETRTREFVLTHPKIQIPKSGRTYSVNEGNYHRWDPQTRKLVDYFREIDEPSNRPYSLRYAGSLAADLHRTLLEGGVYLYPADQSDPEKPTGKLRLLYEAAPLAFLTETAGGGASTGKERILDIQPTSYHQRVPLIIGSIKDVALAETFCQGQRPNRTP